MINTCSATEDVSSLLVLSSFHNALSMSFYSDAATSGVLLALEGLSSPPRANQILDIVKDFLSSQACFVNVN
jgi:hypothetical protein